MLSKYNNGNTTVTIYQDGTKTREYEGTPVIVHPESIDVKITDYCDMGCEFCHESSTTEGIHGDLHKLLEVLSVLPAGVELAVGGGNPLSHPNLVWFLEECKKRGFIANITVNQGHLKVYKDLLTELITSDLVKGIGISIIHNNYKYIDYFKTISDNLVYHVIAGIHESHIIDELGGKILILGYKQFGFGVKYYSPEIEKNIRRWYQQLPKYLGKCILSFDNLAIEQLNVRRLFTDEGWSKFYMGDDFCFTMYIDAVKQNYAPTSRSSTRCSFEELTLLEYFSFNGLNTSK